MQTNRGKNSDIILIILIIAVKIITSNISLDLYYQYYSKNVISTNTNKMLMINFKFKYQITIYIGKIIMCTIRSSVYVSVTQDNNSDINCTMAYTSNKRDY